MVEIPTAKATIKGWPVAVYSSGAVPMPSEMDFIGLLQKSPMTVYFPNNFAIDEVFSKPGSVGSYYMAAFLGQKPSGMGKFNAWEMTRITLDQAEIDTIGHDPITPVKK